MQHTTPVRWLPSSAADCTKNESYTNAKVRASLPGTAFLNREQEMSFQRVCFSLADCRSYASVEGTPEAITNPPRGGGQRAVLVQDRTNR